MLTDYTEQQIRSLTGRELWVAVYRLVLGDDLTANTEERIALAICDMHGRTDLSLGWAIGYWRRRNTLTAPELRAVEQHVANWRAEPLPMPLDCCVPELMGPGKVLEDNHFGWSRPYKCYQVVEIFGDPDENVAVIADADDPATAICRAACIVALREGE